MGQAGGGRRGAWSAVLALLVLALGFGAGTLIARTAQEATLPAAVVPVSQETSDSQEAQEVPAPDVPSTAPTDEAHQAWNPTVAPNYYQVIGLAVVGEMPAPGTVVYGDLDARGRATGARALVTYDSMQAGRSRERDDTSGMEPSGWGHNAEVDIAMPDGSIYHGLLFNRSHLVAKSLGGAEDIRNLICGTRTQNVGANVAGTEGGMAYAEGRVRDYLDANPAGWVYYAVEPRYVGDELVARSIVVDARSDDASIDERIVVYNAALGFDINYATGEFAVTVPAGDAAASQGGSSGPSASAAGPAVETGVRIVPTGSSEPEDGERKVIVTRSGKAYHHDETCRGLVNARSMEWVTVSQAEGMGRHPCGICGG